jgi:hypothetical protein
MDNGFERLLKEAFLTLFERHYHWSWNRLIKP